MRACARCGADGKAEDAFCGHCGAAMPPPPVEDPAPPASAGRARSGGYERAVEHLDPLSANFVGAAAVQAFVYGVIAGVATIVVMIAFGVETGSQIAVGVWFIAFLVYLFTRIPVSLSEWKTLVEGRGSDAQAVFGHVAHTLRRRKAPVDSISIRQLSQPGHPRRDYLQVRHGILTGYVTCFPYGTDLYVGWTLWWRFSPFHFALMAAGRRWQTLTGRGTELHLVYRYDVAKAMREAMHASTGEAVDAAHGLLPLEPLPADMPVEAVRPSQLLATAASRSSV